MAVMEARRRGRRPDNLARVMGRRRFMAAMSLRFTTGRSLRVRYDLSLRTLDRRSGLRRIARHFHSRIAGVMLCDCPAIGVTAFGKRGALGVY